VRDVVAVVGDRGLGEETAAGAGVCPQVKERFEVLTVELVELWLALSGGDRGDEPAVVVVFVNRGGGAGGFPSVEAADGDPEC
jgi:hypothetical protein